MELRDIYRLGSSITYCRRMPLFLQADLNVPVFGDGFILTTLDEIARILEKNNISTSTQKSIKAFTNRLQNDYSEDSENQFIVLEDAEELRDSARIWADRISGELSNIVVFKAFTDGRLNPTKLCEGAMSFFQPKIWKKLPKIIEEDLEESAKCLLTQSWTASGLMAMRALESGVRKYYSDITGNPIDKRTYGGMIGELKRDESSDKKLIGYLDYLKDIRNDLAHANIRINQFRAEQAFQHTIEILTIIYE